MNWRRGIFVLAGAVLAVAAFGLLLSPAPDPTPIRDFSAPRMELASSTPNVPLADMRPVIDVTA